MSTKRQDPLHEFSALVALSENPNDLLDFILRLFKERTDSPKASIDVIAKDGMIDLQFNLGLPKRAIKWLPDEGVTGWVLDRVEIVNIPDVRKDDRYRHGRPGVRSELTAPLLFQNKTVGIVNLESSKPNAFQKGDEDLLRAIAPYLALYVENQRVETLQLTRQSEQLKSLVSIGQAIAAVTAQPEEILKQIVDSANRLLGADVSLLYRFDSRTHGFLPNPTVSGKLLQERVNVKEAPRKSGGMAARVKDQGIVVVEDIDASPEMHSSFTKAEQIRSFVGVALKAGGDFIGVLYVNFRAPRLFPEHERFVIQVFADQAAIAVRKAGLLEQFAILNEIGQRLNHGIQDGDFYQVVYQEVSRVFNTEVFLVVQYHESSQTVDIWVMDRDQWKWVENQPLDGLTGWVIRERKPLLIADIREASLPVPPRQIQTQIPESPLSHLFMPLMVGERILGVLSVQSYEAGMYDEEDLQLLSTLAAHVAVAMDNHELYRTLEQLQRVGQNFALELKTEEMVTRILESARRDLGADLVYLYSYDEEKGQPFALPPFQSGEVLDKTFPAHMQIREDDIANLLVRRGQSYYATDAVNDEVVSGPREKRRADRFVVRERIRSSAGVVLKAQDKVVGVMFINYRTAQRFDARQRQQIELLADYAGRALAGARSVNQIQRESDRRLAQLKALAEIDKAITTAPLKVVFEKILDAAMEIAGNQDGRGNIPLVDESGEYLDPPIAMRGGAWLEGTFRKFKIGDRGIVGNVALTKKPARITDLKEKGWWTEWYVEVYPDTRSELAVPMVEDHGKLVGVINLESSRVGAFSEEDESLLLALAQQGAIAYQGARRFEAEQRARRELEALAEIAKAISRTSNLKDVLQLILEKAMGLVDAPTGNIMLYDRERGDLWMAADKGTLPEHEGSRQPLEHGIVGKAAHEKRPQRVADVTVTPWDTIYLQFIPNVHSELAVPMVRGSELIGVINIESPEVSAFSADDERLLQTFAGQAIIALRGKQMLEALHEVDTAIIENRDLNQILKLLLEHGKRLINAERGDIYLYAQRTTELVSYAHFDLNPNALPFANGAKARFLLQDATGIVGYVAQTKRAYLSNGDVQKDVRYVGGKEFHSEVAVPLIVGETMVGVINLESREQDAFFESDLELLKVFAGQAAIAIQNTRNQERLRILYEVSGKIINAQLDIDQLLDIALSSGMERTGAHTASARWWDEQKNKLEARRRLGDEHERAGEPITVSEESANAWVALRRETLVIPDVDHLPEGIPYRRGHPATKSELIVPLRVGDAYLGNLDFGHPEINDFDAEEIKLVEGIAAQVAGAIQRVQQREEIERVNQRKQEAEYMGAISVSLMEIVHKIGNSLGPIRTYVQEIREVLGSVDSEVNKRLEEILRDTNVALTLVKKLREERAKEMELSTEEHIIPARTILFEASRSYPMPENVIVEINCSDDISPIEGDNRIHDAFANLFTNAVQALQLQGGHIELGARATNGEVEFWVKDDGPGIPRANQKSIFELFYSTKPEGIGFGLWSVRRNIFANGGTIEVESDVGQGATFKVRLPRSRGESLMPNVDSEHAKDRVALVEAVGADFKRDFVHKPQKPSKLEPSHPEMIGSGGLQLQAGRLTGSVKAKGRILVVEDEKNWQHVLSRTLTEGGYFVEIASTVQEAQQKLAASLYHLLTLDLRLVDSDATNVSGLGLLNTLEQFGFLGGLEVIMLTAFSTTAVMREAFMRHRVRDFLTKDEFDSAEFLRIVNDVFENQIKANSNLDMDFDPNFRFDDLAAEFELDLPQTLSISQERIEFEFMDLLCRLFNTSDKVVVRPAPSGYADQFSLTVDTYSLQGLGRFFVQVNGFRTIEKYLQSQAASVENTTAIPYTISNVCRTPLLEGIAYNADLAEQLSKVKKANQQLAVADRQKFEFLAIASHELRQPLTHVNHVLERALVGEYGEIADTAFKDKLKIAFDSGRHLADLVERLLNVARIEPGKIKPEVAPCNVVELIQDSVRSIEHSARRRNIKVTVDLPTEPPMVDLDRVKIKEVLDNLLDNAIKYNVPGGKISVSCISRESEIEIQVSDTGRGIPQDKQERIYEWFYQVDPSLTRSVEGLGLGLYIANTYVKMHGGQLKLVSSEVERGSTFAVILPTKHTS